jgi:metal-responsive CopG/Arc/MetJ family transcriptional regulator
MKVSTSVAMPADLLASIDRVEPSRSAFFERASRSYLAQMRKARRDAKDAPTTNANAKRLNREALDVLEYQGPPRLA